MVLVGRIGAAHGLKGEVRVKTLTTEPMAVARYTPLTDAGGRRFEVLAARPAAGPASEMLVVRFKGVGDRNAAEALNGIDLYVPRDRLPAPEPDEFYHADLIGLAVVTLAGEALGTVVGVENYGAGDLIAVAPRRGQPLLVPFTRAVVPEVDLAGGRLIVDPPPGLIGGDAADDEA